MGPLLPRISGDYRTAVFASGYGRSRLDESGAIDYNAYVLVMAVAEWAGVLVHVLPQEPGGKAVQWRDS